MVHTGTFSRQQRRWSALVFVTGLVLLVFVIWLWWHFVYSNPNRTFFAAIDNGLRTSDVSKVVTQEASGQKLVQDVGVNVSSNHTAYAKTKITQTAETNTEVRTEAIGTPRSDYVRYTAIETNQKGFAGNALNFSELLNIWGKTQSPDKTNGELYGESVLGVVPFGSLSVAERKQVMKYIRENDVFVIDESKVERKIRDGRPVYVYDLTVAAEDYVGMLKAFAKAAGLTQLEDIDPATYKDAQPIDIQLTVDVWSRQVTELRYGEGERIERFGSYGVSRDTELPKKTIPVEELQQRLQAIQ